MSEPMVRRSLPATGVLERLLDAAVAEVGVSGYAHLTIRLVARRAGVAAATAYNYFSSKEHLFAAIFLRLVQHLPPLVPPGGTEGVERRIERTVQGMADVLGADPALREAFRAAMLGTDPDAERVRDAAISMILERFDEAFEDSLDETSRETVLISFVGTMIMASMGRLPFDALGKRVADMLGPLLK